VTTEINSEPTLRQHYIVFRKEELIDIIIDLRRQIFELGSDLEECRKFSYNDIRYINALEKEVFRKEE